MDHRRSHHELLAALSEYVLDLLDENETAEVEAHLREGCPICEQHLRELREMAGILGCGAPSADPPPSLRERVTAIPYEAEVQVWKDWDGRIPAAMHIVRAEEGQWEQVAEGIHAKRLYLDRERDMVTMLIRMNPGATYHPHRHAGPEQCFVLEGDLRDADVVVRSGDYQCLAPGTIHGAQTTESGCLLLIVSSLHDELLR